MISDQELQADARDQTVPVRLLSGVYVDPRHELRRSGDLSQLMLSSRLLKCEAEAC